MELSFALTALVFALIANVLSWRTEKELDKLLKVMKEAAEEEKPAGEQEDPKPTTVIQQVDSSFKYDGKEYRLDGNLRVDGYVVCTEKKEEE